MRCFGQYRTNLFPFTCMNRKQFRPRFSPGLAGACSPPPSQCVMRCSCPTSPSPRQVGAERGGGLGEQQPGREGLHTKCRGRRARRRPFEPTQVHPQRRALVRLLERHRVGEHERAVGAGLPGKALVVVLLTEFDDGRLPSGVAGRLQEVLELRHSRDVGEPFDTLVLQPAHDRGPVLHQHVGRIGVDEIEARLLLVRVTLTGRLDAPDRQVRPQNRRLLHGIGKLPGDEQPRTHRVLGARIRHRGEHPRRQALDVRGGVARDLDELALDHRHRALVVLHGTRADEREDVVFARLLHRFALVEDLRVVVPQHEPAAVDPAEAVTELDERFDRSVDAGRRDGDDP